MVYSNGVTEEGPALPSVGLGWPVGAAANISRASGVEISMRFQTSFPSRRSLPRVLVEADLRGTAFMPGSKL